MSNNYEVFSPFGSDRTETRLGKWRHHLKIGMRVKVKHSGTGETHYGEITNISGDNRIHVQVDGPGSEDARRIQCFADECQPEEWPGGQRPVGNLKGLNSEHLRAAAEVTRERISKSLDGGLLDPFGIHDTQETRMLKALDAQQASETLRERAAEFLSKRAGGSAHSPDTDPEFSMGQRVVNKMSGKKGRITRLDYGFAHVAHEDGTNGVTTCDLLEACAA